MSHATLVSRSNYFAVRDFDAFTAALDTHGVAWANLDDMAAVDGALLIDHGCRGGLPGHSVALRAYGRWPEPECDDLPRRTLQSVVAGDEHGRCVMCSVTADEHGGPVYNDLVSLVAAHLVDGEVAVFKTAGLDSHDRPIGSATAVNCSGDRSEVSLNDIYTVADALGANVDNYA